MAIKCAVIGLDPIQADWFGAVRALVAEGVIELVAAGHQTTEQTRDLAEALGTKPFDDLRQLLVIAAPRLVLMDRPENVTLELLRACFQQDAAVFSIGPPVRSLAEAQALREVLGPSSHLLGTAPRLAASPAYARCARADEFVRPFRFASARWLAFSHAHAAKMGRHDPDDVLVRSMSVLAWDAFGAIIDLMGIPESLYASIRGTVSGGDEFTEISGSASISLSFADRCVMSVTLSDRAGPWQRDLLIAGQNGILQLTDAHYRFNDAQGKLIDEGAVPRVSAERQATEALRGFVERLGEPTSPRREFTNHLEEIAATMEAMLVSNRTGAAENPERLRSMRR